MALGDHGIFRHQDQRWIAAVDVAVGAGVAGLALTPDRESVVFTCLDDGTWLSKAATVPAGWLNQIDHRSLVTLLETADQLPERIEIPPANAPDERELGPPDCSDDEELRWVFQHTLGFVVSADGEIREVPAIWAACLDDSALTAVIGLAGGATVRDLKLTVGKAGLAPLAEVVKRTWFRSVSG